MKMKLPGIMLCAGLLVAGCDSNQDDTTGGPFFNSLAGCGISQYTELSSVPTLAAGFRTVIMGSSSAAGAGASQPALSWAGLYRQWQLQSGGDTVNIAKGGYTTYDALPDNCQSAQSRRQPDPAHNVSQALAQAPDLVIIAYPSNDAALGWDASESVANILVLRSVLAQAGVPSLVVGAQPRTLTAKPLTQLERFDRLLQQEVKGCYVPVYADLSSNQQLSPALDAGDGVHVNDQGHALIFKAIQQTLQQGHCVTLPE